MNVYHPPFIFCVVISVCMSPVYNCISLIKSPFRVKQISILDKPRHKSLYTPYAARLKEDTLDSVTTTTHQQVSSSCRPHIDLKPTAANSCWIITLSVSRNKLSQCKYVWTFSNVRHVCPIINTPWSVSFWPPPAESLCNACGGGTPARHLPVPDHTDPIASTPAALSLLRIFLHFWGMCIQIVPGDNKRMTAR